MQEYSKNHIALDFQIIHIKKHCKEQFHTYSCLPKLLEFVLDCLLAEDLETVFTSRRQPWKHMLIFRVNCVLNKKNTTTIYKKAISLYWKWWWRSNIDYI
jgi:hypothetical protein